MRWNCVIFVFVGILIFAVVTTETEAKRKKNKSSYSSNDEASSRAKTKTKWSTTTDLGQQGSNAMVATEEHGYYVKKTYIPVQANNTLLKSRESPPYLAIPIAWFDCSDNSDCHKTNTALSNGINVFSEGFLCDDDCIEPYSPICAKTSSEVAVFYNLCKLNVAKCRSHGLWIELQYDECKQLYSKELEYTDKKFRTSMFFKEDSQRNETVVQTDPQKDVIEKETRLNADILLAKKDEASPTK